MERSLIAHAAVGVPVKICGFIENLRNKRAMAFMVIRDISGKLQVTLEKEPNPELAAVVDGLTLEAVVEITGTIVENEHVKMGGRELLPDGIRALSPAEALPMQKDAGLDTRMDYRWIDLREERNTMIFKVQTVLAQVMRDFLLERGFLEIHTPKIIGAASESGADVFELEYFDSKAYLSQSPQFYKQMAMAAGLERIFEVGPVFRAEKSHTNRHATEFTGFDLEFSYIDSYQDVMTLEAELLTAALTEIAARFGGDIRRVFDTEVVVPALPFPQIKLADLYRELEARYGFTIDDSEKGDLTTEAERLATQYSTEVYGHEFLFVTDFDKEKRAFYHMREGDVPQGYDLLWRGVEITTGAQREHRFEMLCEQAREKGLDEDVKFYLEFFKYGCPPHGGFGIGLDRLTMLLLNIPTIKEVMFLFRGPNRLTP